MRSKADITITQLACDWAVVNSEWFLSFFIFFGHAIWLTGSWFPNQGSNPCLLRWKCSLNHWTTREIPKPLISLLELWETRKTLEISTVHTQSQLPELWRHPAISSQAVQRPSSRPSASQGAVNHWFPESYMLFSSLAPWADWELCADFLIKNNNN